MKHQTLKLNIISIVFTISVVTSTFSHAGEWNNINVFALGTSVGLMSLINSASPATISSPGFSAFAAGFVPQNYGYIFSQPYNNPYTRYINYGVSQYFSGGGCALGSGYCSALNSANSLFSYNSPQVQSIADRCIKLHGYEACRRVGF
jgi:hypothetical protein